MLLGGFVESAMESGKAYLVHFYIRRNKKKKVKSGIVLVIYAS